MKSKSDLYSVFSTIILVIIFAIGTILCSLELREQIDAAEPTGGIGRVMADSPEEPIQPIDSFTSPETQLDETPEEEPFIRYKLTDEERYHIEAVVFAEAGGEDFDGQRLVAQCILNTIEATGKTPLEVIYSPNQYTTPNYDDHHFVSDAVSAVFDDGLMVTEEPIQFFYAPKYCYSEWHEEECEFVLEHGGHRFFKER